MQYTQRVFDVGQEKFGILREIEALDLEDPRTATISAPLGQLSTSNLARLSVGEPLISYGPDYGIEGEDPEAVRSFLAEKRNMAREGRVFTAGELAGLGFLEYLGIQTEAIEDAAGSGPITVSRLPKSIQRSITIVGPEGFLRGFTSTTAKSAVTGTVQEVQAEMGVLILTPTAEGELEPDHSYRIEALRTNKANRGQPQVSIEAAPAQA
ncbi:MAG: hypothetical protein WEC84_03740 [Candidatus Andersenbacteria bacterium]